MLARIISEVAHSETGKTSIRGGNRRELFIDHGTGVVIVRQRSLPARAEYQAVTLGAKRFEVDEHGALIKNYAGIPSSKTTS